MIILIGFSTCSHKLLANICCHTYKHCAPIVIYKNVYNIYQFTNSHCINIIPVKKRDLQILEQYGWKFIKYHTNHINTETRAKTCVQFTKKFCGIHKITIITPDALLKYVQK